MAPYWICSWDQPVAQQTVHVGLAPQLLPDSCTNCRIRWIVPQVVQFAVSLSGVMHQLAVLRPCHLDRRKLAEYCSLLFCARILPRRGQRHALRIGRLESMSSAILGAASAASGQRVDSLAAGP